MIGYISGKVIHKELNILTIEVNGIGHEVNVSLLLFEGVKKGESLSLYVHHNIKDTSEELYGFETANERNVFKTLLSVSGVGPKSALAITSVNSVETIRASIEKGDPTCFSLVSGIGKRTAQKIVIELKDSFDRLEENVSSEVRDVYNALISLGYSDSQAREAILNIPDDITDLEGKIKHTLKSIK